MNASTTREGRLKLSGVLIFVGIVVEVVTLYWSHPLAFLAFLLLGGALVAAGIALYVRAVV